MSLAQSWSFFNKEIEIHRYDRALVIIGHVFFGLQLIMSLIYYKERLLSFDAANYTFQLIYFEDFYIGHDRWISAPTQLLPLLAIKLGASLKVILMSYSASFILFYYVLFNLMVYGLRQARVGVFLALSLCLAMRYKFYGPVGEVILSIGMVGLLQAWLWRERADFSWPAWVHWSLGLGITAMIVFAGHPFAALAVFYLLGFEMIAQRRWKDGQTWAMIALALVGYGRKYISLQAEGSYEAGQMDNLQESFAMLSQFNTYYVFDRISWFFETEYAFPFAIFLIVVGVLCWKRHWLLALFILASHLAMLAAIMIAFAYLNDPIYILLDGYLSHLGIIWSLPIVYVFCQEKKWWSLALLVILLGFGLDRIHEKKAFFQERLGLLEGLLETNVTTQDRKLLHHIDHFDWGKMWMPWAVGVETLMLTALEGPESAATLYFKQHLQDEDDQLQDPNLFLGVHYSPFIFESDSLPKHLFQLKKGLYKRIDPGK